MALLDDDAIEAALTELSAWSREGDAIVTIYELPSFPDAVVFVTRVAFLAEAADHHPDLDIRWRSVRVLLTSHDAGGITRRDIELARSIEALGAR